MAPDEPQSILLSMPTEIRLEIYSYLLDNGGNEWIEISNSAALGSNPAHTHSGGGCHNDDEPSRRRPPRPVTRTKYHIMKHAPMCQQVCVETTYTHSHGQRPPNNTTTTPSFHTAVMQVCRQLYHEAADVLYGGHGFDFGRDIEAVAPFFADRTAHTRALVRAVAVYKRGPFPSFGYGSHSNEWAHMCRCLAAWPGKGPQRKMLRVVVEGGRPTTTTTTTTCGGEQRWGPVQHLSGPDIRLLTGMNVEVLEWTKDLLQVQGLGELQIVPCRRFMPRPASTPTIVYAALSASLEDGLLDFFRSAMTMARGGRVTGVAHQSHGEDWDGLGSQVTTGRRKGSSRE